MSASHSSTPSSFFRSSLSMATATVVALGAIAALGTGCASTGSSIPGDALGVPSISSAAPHDDSRIAHFDREATDHRIF